MKMPGRRINTCKQHQRVSSPWSTFSERSKIADHTPSKSAYTATDRNYQLKKKWNWWNIGLLYHLGVSFGKDLSLPPHPLSIKLNNNNNNSIRLRYNIFAGRIYDQLKWTGI